MKKSVVPFVSVVAFAVIATTGAHANELAINNIQVSTLETVTQTIDKQNTKDIVHSLVSQHIKAGLDAITLDMNSGNATQRELLVNNLPVHDDNKLALNQLTGE